VKTLLKLYSELLPVMAFIPVGYFLKKKFNIQAKYISGPLIKVLLPLVVFFNILDAEAQKLYILPVMTFLLALAMNPVANFAHRKFAGESDPLLLRSSFSFFNIAFFGIPTITALFGEKEVSTLICIYLGSALYGDTIGYFQVAKTKLPKSEAIRKVLQIPFLYVFVAALTCKLFEVETPEFLKSPLKVVSFCVSSAGMLIVGLQLANVDFKDLKGKLYAKLFALRTVAAALLIGVLILAEHLIISQLKENDYKMLALVPLFPVAANVTVFASFLKTGESESVLLVFLSTILSLVLVSLAVVFLF
jgi:predicted permease